MRCPSQHELVPQTFLRDSFGFGIARACCLSWPPLMLRGRVAQKAACQRWGQASKATDWEPGEERKQNNSTYSTTRVGATKQGWRGKRGSFPEHGHSTRTLLLMGNPMDRGRPSEPLCSVPVSKESQPAGPTYSGPHHSLGLWFKHHLQM